jgi:nicotinic acid mononucleotide adenylyltransferase
MRVRAGVYPGSFDPLTTAHLAIAEAAIARFDLERLDLVLSRVALAKEHVGQTSVDERAATIARILRDRPQVDVVITDLQLVADIAEGYDVCVVGADKWHQLHDLGFYDGSPAARDAALARLPTLAVAPRTGFRLPAPTARAVVLDIASGFHDVSSTAVRAGREDWRAG